MQINKLISFITFISYFGEVICSKCQQSTITTTLVTYSYLEATTKTCEDGAYRDQFGNCVYINIDYCANIALGIDGDHCTPKKCEYFYGLCACADGYLDIYGCVCGCDQTTIYLPKTKIDLPKPTITTTLVTYSYLEATTKTCEDGAYSDQYGNCVYIYIDYCANKALGIDGLDCPPDECEYHYGPCPCANGYLDIHGCVCGCDQTTIDLPITTITTTLVTYLYTDTTTKICDDGAYSDQYGNCVYTYYDYCANIALGIDGFNCPPNECEYHYGPCPCANGYLDIHECVCGCDQTTIDLPITFPLTTPSSENTIDSYSTIDQLDICANIALGIQGDICSPSECEYIYGPCPCGGGYVGYYGCVCSICTTTVFPTTFPFSTTV